MHGFAAGLHGGVHELGDFAAQRFHFLLKALAHLLDGHAAVVRVQVVGRFGQLGLRVFGLGKEHAVLHVAIGRDDDEQHAPLGKAHEFDVAENG